MQYTSTQYILPIFGRVGINRNSFFLLFLLYINKKSILSHASPSIRKLARELGCEINNIIGTGQNNRIIKQDI